MSAIWRMLSLVGTLLVLAIGGLFIWGAEVPEALVNAFATLLLAGLGVLVIGPALGWKAKSSG